MIRLADRSERSHGWATADRRDVIGLAAILSLALVVRLWGLDSQSLTNDEVDDLLVAREDGSFGTLLRGARRFPPLYHLILRGWLAVFPSDYSARLLSVLIGLATVATLWLVGRHLAGSRGGVAVASLAAISPFLVWYSQETRVYGLYLFLASVGLLLLVRALDMERRRDWLWLAVALVAGAYTHYYFGVFILIALAAILLRARAWGSVEVPRSIAVLAALGAAPSLLLLLRDLEGEWGDAADAAFGLAPMGYTYVSVATGYTVGPSLRKLHTIDAADAVTGFAPWLVVIAVVGGILGLAAWRSLERRHAVILVLFGSAPVVLVGLASTVGPFGYNVRHVIWISIPVLVVMGAGLAASRGARQWIAVGLVATLSLTALINRLTDDEYRNEDSRAVADEISAQADSGPVFVVVDYMAEPVAYYLGSDHLVVELPDVSASGEGLTAALRTISTNASNGSFWLGVSRTFDGDPSGMIVSTLSSEGRLEAVAAYAGFTLYRGVPQ